VYSLPTHLSELSRDLIPRMLVVDPLKRITLPEIRAHPWFRTKLPLYLAIPPSVAEAEAEAVAAARKFARRRPGGGASVGGAGAPAALQLYGYGSSADLLSASTSSLGSLEAAAARETLGVGDVIDPEIVEQVLRLERGGRGVRAAGGAQAVPPARGADRGGHALHRPAAAAAHARVPHRGRAPGHPRLLAGTAGGVRGSGRRRR
jgi:hypothetical protein